MKKNKISIKRNGIKIDTDSGAISIKGIRSVDGSINIAGGDIVTNKNKGINIAGGDIYDLREVKK